MKSWQQAFQDSVVPGMTAGAAALGSVAFFGRSDTRSAMAPINATSHVLWGNESAQVESLTLRHSLPGLLINAGAGFWWALVYQKLFGEAVDRGGVGTAVAGGLATVAIAYVVDYKLVPKRLTPGWEERITNRSLYFSLAAMGVGLGLGAMLGKSLK